MFKNIKFWASSQTYKHFENEAKMCGCLTSSLDDSAEGMKPMLVPRWCLGTAVYTECSCHSYFLLHGARKARTVTARCCQTEPKDVTPHRLKPLGEALGLCRVKHFVFCSILYGLKHISSNLKATAKGFHILTLQHCKWGSKSDTYKLIMPVVA